MMNNRTPLAALVMAAALMPLSALAEIDPQQCLAEDTADESTPSQRFERLESGAVIHDTETGLQWDRCSLGQGWNPNTDQCGGDAELVDLPRAMEVAAEKSNWRLPNANELLSIVEYCADENEPTVNAQVFPDTPDESFHSDTVPEITLVDGEVTHAPVSVDFASGAVAPRENPSGELAVRLVRDADTPRRVTNAED